MQRPDFDPQCQGAMESVLTEQVHLLHVALHPRSMLDL
jgi:hypothetical protein